MIKTQARRKNELKAICIVVFLGLLAVPVAAQQMSLNVLLPELSGDALAWVGDGGLSWHQPFDGSYYVEDHSYLAFDEEGQRMWAIRHPRLLPGQSCTQVGYFWSGLDDSRTSILTEFSFMKLAGCWVDLLLEAPSLGYSAERYMLPSDNYATWYFNLVPIRVPLDDWQGAYRYSITTTCVPEPSSLVYLLTPTLFVVRRRKVA